MSIGEVVTVIIMVFGFLILGLIKKTPDHVLNRSLESFKSDLQKELVNFRISGENLHPAKIEEYMHFTKVFTQLMELSKLKDPEKQVEEQKKVYDGLTRFGFSAILFGSDETVKKYVEIRKYTTLPSDKLGENEKALMLLLMSELIILMRNDLGNSNSNVSSDDFMQIVIKDWEISKEEFKRKAGNAIKL
ncbi:hypothetical protein [Salibacterium lacus]|uniref:Uncharacterized protein n=1 Tax=Salibacterium lacus TaxID=1898109 RepID=A0ABW5SWC2_9BACI